MTSNTELPNTFEIFFAKYQELLQLYKNPNPTSNTDEITTTNLPIIDLQTATKKILQLAFDQSPVYLQKLNFSQTLSKYFLLTINNKTSCSPLLSEIGWDLLTEFFLLCIIDKYFSIFLYAICNSKKANLRELCIMFSEILTHPILNINAIHHSFHSHSHSTHASHLANIDIGIEKTKDLEPAPAHTHHHHSQSPILLKSKPISYCDSINYCQLQKIFVTCVKSLLVTQQSQKLTNVSTSVMSLVHLYERLLPSIISHLNVLSKELSWSFFSSYSMKNSHPPSPVISMGDEHHSFSSLTGNGDEFNAKKEFLEYLDTIYDIFIFIVHSYLSKYGNDGRLQSMIDVFHGKCQQMVDEKNTNVNEIFPKTEEKLWILRFALGIISSVYYWYNIQISTKENVFMYDMIDKLKEHVLIHLVNNLKINIDTIFELREYILKLEMKLESLKPWHLHADEIYSPIKSNATPTPPTLKSMSNSNELTTIVEEQMNEKKDKMESVSENDWSDDDDENPYKSIDVSKLHQMKETQAIVEELRIWNEFLDPFYLSCYYHSFLILLQKSSMLTSNLVLFQKNRKYFWQCIGLLLEHETTLPAGIEFAEYFLKVCYSNVQRRRSSESNVNESDGDGDGDSQMNSFEFHSYGLWFLIQKLIPTLRLFKDQTLHQKIWKFIVHILNCCDLKARFKIITSVAVQCPISMVQSLMFQELKNQIWNTWNMQKEEELVVEQKMDDLNLDIVEQVDELLPIADEIEVDWNPFCSQSLIMVLVQRLNKDLRIFNEVMDNCKSGSSFGNHSLFDGLDSLNACLNVIRFILNKDLESNRTNVYDEDCPLRNVLVSLQMLMTSIVNYDGNVDGDEEEGNSEEFGSGLKSSDLMAFQQNLMKNQLLVSLDLVNSIVQNYKKYT